MTMRQTLRVLALIDLALYGLGLAIFLALYLPNPCLPGLDGLRYLIPLIFFLALAIPLALIAASVAAILAASRRQRGWLAGILLVAGASIALIGVYLDFIPSPILLPLAVFGRAFDHAFGLGCGGVGPSLLYTVLVYLTLLSVTPIVLLIYGFSGASGAVPSSASGVSGPKIDTQRLLWIGAVIALALNVMLTGVRLTELAPMETVRLPFVGFAGGAPFKVAAFILAPIGVMLAFVLGGALAVLAARRRQRGWLAGLLFVEVAILALDVVVYGASAVFISSLRWGVFGLLSPYDLAAGRPYGLPFVLPIALPLVSLAYVWWSGRQPGSDRAPAPPTHAIL